MGSLDSALSTHHSSLLGISPIKLAAPAFCQAHFALKPSSTWPASHIFITTQQLTLPPLSWTELTRQMLFTAAATDTNKEGGSDSIIGTSTTALPPLSRQMGSVKVSTELQHVSMIAYAIPGERARELVPQPLACEHDDKARAAELLSIDLSTLYRKLKRYGR
jgi:hypothetical protein